MEDIYFNELMESAREAAAFAHGDSTRCRVVFRKNPVLDPGCRPNQEITEPFSERPHQKKGC